MHYAATLTEETFSGLCWDGFYYSSFVIRTCGKKKKNL